MTTTDKTDAAPKVKRCPACGRDDTLKVGWFARDRAMRVVYCSIYGGCGVRGPGVLVADTDQHAEIVSAAERAADADAIAAWNALPRRKRVKRAKAERAVDALTKAQTEVNCANAYTAVVAATAARDAARARLTRMLTGDDGKAKGVNDGD